MSGTFESVRAMLRAVLQPMLADKPDARALDSIAKLDEVIEEKARNTASIQDVMNQLYPPEGR